MKFKDKYFDQLSNGCKNSNCLKAFCRKITSLELAEKISEILCEYEDLFLCENTNKLFNSEIFKKKTINKKNWCINLLFYYSDIYDSQRNCKNIKLHLPYKKRDDSIISNVDHLKIEDRKHLNIEDRKHLNIEDRKHLNIEDRKHLKIEDEKHLKIEDRKHLKIEDRKHLFCKYFNKKLFSPEEYFLITGILHIFIKKYEKNTDFNLGLIILRLYSICCSYACKDIYNLSMILQILNKINNFDNKKCEFKKQKFQKTELINVTFEEQTYEDKQGKNTKENINNIFLKEEPKDNCRTNIENQTYFFCLEENEITKNDILRLISNLKETLNRFTSTNIRESKNLEFTLNLFYALFLINEKLQICPTKKFYLTQFCGSFNFKDEYKFYRSKSKTILNYPFILPVHTKAELLKYENNDLMKASLQDSFFRSLFEGHTEPYLFITVSRENIYNDSLEIFKEIKYENVHKQLRITFKNEEGVDSGGIRKEYFQLLSHDIISDKKLFSNTEHTLWIREDCFEIEKFYCIGKILGVALYNNVVLNIPFPGFFFKKLLNIKTNFNDLKEIDVNLHLSLSNLKKLSHKEIEDLDLNYIVVYTTNTGDIKHINLDELGRNIKVTGDNVTHFTNKYADLIINKQIKKQFDAIKEGFYFVINKNILTNLSHKELEKIIIGSNNFNISEIRVTTSYNGYQEDSLIIKYFWEIFESYNKKMRKKLLQFITGHDRIPVAGSKSLKLIIMKNGCDTDRLPSSQTCFNTLLLPEYSSKQKLEEKLKTALEMTAGFFLL